MTTALQVTLELRCILKKVDMQIVLKRLIPLACSRSGLSLMLACILCVSIVQSEVHAQTDASGRIYKEDGSINTKNKYGKPRAEAWNESKVDLPLPPQKNGFTLFQTTSQSGFRFYVDISSIQYGDDGVIRMVLRAVSPKGSENITYEGFRCATREYKFYASSFGFDKPWMSVKSPQWRSAQYQTANSYRNDLMEYYMCLGDANILKERQLKVFFKKGKMRKQEGRRSQ